MPQSKASADWFKRDRDAAGIKESPGDMVTFHSLRNYFINELSRAGVPVRTVQQLARHANVTTTMKHYTRVYVEDERTALEAISWTNREHKLNLQNQSM